MKITRVFCLLLGLGLALMFSEGSAFATGTASAAGEVTAETTRGDIQKDKRDRTGGLTVREVKVLDKFGRRTRTLKRDVDYEVEGDTSTSPTIKFKPSANLEGGEYCTVEMTSTKDGTHDLDIKFS